MANPPTVDYARKLYAVDKIGKQENKGNLTLIITNAVNSVDKVTYFLDGDRLKILIHPLPGSAGVFKNQVSFEESQKADLIFAVGFKTQDTLRREITHEQDFSSTWLININNDPSSEKFAQLNLTNQDSVSLSETTASLFQELALPVDEDIAFNLFKGISEATSNFSPSKVSPSTFQFASWLIKFGAGKASLAQENNSNNQPPNLTSNNLSPFGQTPISTRDFPQPAQEEDDTDFFQALEETPIEDVEREKKPPEDWTKPPKVYKGAKSFDKEN